MAKLLKKDIQLLTEVLNGYCDNRIDALLMRFDIARKQAIKENNLSLHGRILRDEPIIKFIKEMKNDRTKTDQS